MLESIEARRRWMEGLTTALPPEQQEEIIAALTALTQAALKTEGDLAYESFSGAK